MNETDMCELERRVMANVFKLQETYQLDGVCYVLEMGNAASPDRYTLWAYPQGEWARVYCGDTIAECIACAATYGVPVERLSLDSWHD